MRTTTILTVALTLALFTGCSTGIKRTDYKIAGNREEKDLSQCAVAVKFNARYRPEDVEMLGSVKGYDTGFSVHCDEAYVLELFCKEACMLGADLVNITEEKQPDYWSSCYRAKAEFVRFKDRDRVKSLYSDVAYTPQFVIQRSLQSKQRNQEAIRAGVMGGLVGGLISGAVTGR
jgi:hypothetical protein